MATELTYHKPRYLTDLWGCLADADGRVRLLAGGTDVVPALKRGLDRPTALIDIKRLPELQGIARTDAPAFSFQGHPEASPGPHDMSYLFDRFIKLMADHAQAH